MLVKQIAVFLENKKGRVHKLTKVIADAGIDIISMSIADTSEYGILRAITRDNDKAVKVLKDAGFTATTNDLIGLTVDDKPGGLNKALEFLNKKDIAIEYMYSFARSNDKAIIVLKVEDLDKAVKIIQDNGIELLNNEKI